MVTWNKDFMLIFTNLVFTNHIFRTIINKKDYMDGA